MTISCEPFYFGPAEQTLFGWYHPAQGAARNCGVVLCNPIGDDYVRAHRTLRHLAEALSKSGFAVLRFDFHGTGDSAGDEREAGRVAAWQKDVGVAVDTLRAKSGCSHIALLGLRLGGTMAMTAAAARNDIDDLILWAPYLTGGAYVTETTKLHQMHKILEPQSFAAEPKSWDAGGQEALGFLLTPPTVDALKKIDLTQVSRAPAKKMLVIDTGNVPAETKLLAHLQSIGVDVEHRHLPGHKFLIMIPHRSEVPRPIIDAVVQWLSSRHAASGTRANDARWGKAREAVPNEGGREGPPVVTTGTGTGTAMILADGVSETPIVFGRAHPLFGILVRPPQRSRRADRPAIVMTNAGCVHRIGAHRAYVPMARRWAALGFDVFRIDLSGIGDSPVAPGCTENVTYPRDGVEDIDEAMKSLTATTGAKRFVVLGLCSGGDLAFQAGFRNQDVVGAVMINPRTFCVNDLEMVESYKRARYYQDSLFRAESWKKALRGQVDFGRALGMVVPKVKDLFRRRVEKWMAPKKSATAGDKALNDVPACLRMMASRGVDTFVLVSEKDPGIDYVDGVFGPKMAALSSVTNYHREDFMGTDHTFTSLFAQAKVSELLSEHFSRRFA